MSNVIAGVVRGQIPYLEEYIAKKKEIYLRYKEGFKNLPVKMNSFDEENCEPNYWVAALIIDENAMCRQVRGEREALYVAEPGKSCPTEILETLADFNAEERPVWKPMHMQLIYRMNGFVAREGNGRARTNAYIAGGIANIDMDIFDGGLCLPTDIIMTAEEQNTAIEFIKYCFK